MSETTINPLPAKAQAVAMTGQVSGFAGLALATVDYYFKCRGAHMIIQPDNALVIFWATGIAPTAHMLWNAFNRRLQKLVQEDQHP